MKVEFDESEKIGLRNDFSKITPLWPAVQWQWVSWKQYENICKCNIPCVPAIDGGQLDLSGILNAGHWACELDLRSNLCPLCCHLYIRLGSYLLFNISLDDTWEYNGELDVCSYKRLLCHHLALQCDNIGMCPVHSCAVCIQLYH